MTHEDPAYRHEIEMLAQECESFLDAYDKARALDASVSRVDPFRGDVLLRVGLILGQCANIYNLSPPGGLMHPSLLFRGWQEALGWKGGDEREGEAR